MQMALTNVVDVFVHMSFSCLCETLGNVLVSQNQDIWRHVTLIFDKSK